MFNHNQCISKISQISQCIQKLIIVSLMQSNAWLIQNIGHTYQSGTNLGCQTDSLCLTSGKSTRRSCKCQIIKSNIHQKADTCPDLF